MFLKLEKRCRSNRRWITAKFQPVTYTLQIVGNSIKLLNWMRLFLFLKEIIPALSPASASPKENNSSLPYHPS